MTGSITLFTSGSTKEPKLISHDRYELGKHINRSVKEIGLTSKDIVLDVFPANVIAHYTVTAIPALEAGSHLVSAVFDPYSYINLFKKYQPTFISLIPRHISVLEKTKEWHNLDMRCVRYMVTGSQTIDQIMIDNLLSKGIKIVANWYGMTEFPPPVFIGYNSETFDFTPKDGYSIDFSDEGECIINGTHTNDLFDIKEKKFLKRKSIDGNNHTWKS